MVTPLYVTPSEFTGQDSCSDIWKSRINLLNIYNWKPEETVTIVKPRGAWGSSSVSQGEPEEAVTIVKPRGAVQLHLWNSVVVIL